MKNKFQWKDKPNKTMVQDDLIEMVAPKDTNLFNSPNGTFSCENFPFLYDEIEGDFSVKCQMRPEFVSPYDLGSIVVWENRDRWIKFAYENSDVGYPAIVSVVTEQYSDDCNGPEMRGTVWLQICRRGNTFALHYSKDNKLWNLARIFRLSMASKVCVGLSAQCPAGEQCKVTFWNFEISNTVPENIRNVNK